MEFCEYADRELLAMDLANRIAGELNAALKHEERVLLAVPGGTSPGPIFDDLCDTSLDWDRVDVTLTDERWVPETSDRSNAALLRARLLCGKAAAAHMLPLYLGGMEPEAALTALSERLEPRLPISVLLLGMGADMHTASLFPGADNLDAALDPQAPPLVAITAPGAPEPRVTLSAPVLNGALSKHLVIFGAEKREALERARKLPAREAPVRAVLDGAVVHWAE